MPLNSAICEPAPHARADGRHDHACAAMPIATARAIVRVDVSIDGGRSWSTGRAGASTPTRPGAGPSGARRSDLPKGEHELAVRAWDSAGQTQPARPDDTWNFKGYLSAAWHRVPVSVSLSAVRRSMIAPDPGPAGCAQAFWLAVVLTGVRHRSWRRCTDRIAGAGAAHGLGGLRGRPARGRDTRRLPGGTCWCCSAPAC